MEVYEDYDNHVEEMRVENEEKERKKICWWFTVTYNISIWSSRPLFEKKIKGLKLKN